jgi:hypothetical protein
MTALQQALAAAEPMVAEHIEWALATLAKRQQDDNKDALADPLHRKRSAGSRIDDLPLAGSKPFFHALPTIEHRHYKRKILMQMLGVDIGGRGSRAAWSTPKPGS